MSSWLSELQTKRQAFVNSVRDNEFEGGVRQSAVEKYADPVHFIFELIQNAEDQEATLARFSLRDNVIVFEHDGKPFSQEDVKRITGWGQSDKPNQANKIGRFGIGFKSVFVVTDSPEIYIKDGVASPIPSFRIRDLFVPDPRYSIAADCDCATRFVLRLRTAEAKRLLALIQGRFENFSADVLLFLHYLKRIEWSAGSMSGVCERSDRDGIRSIWTTFKPSVETEQQTRQRYLVFSRPITVQGTERKQTVKLAFSLDSEGRIVAEEPEPPVHVFFPTEERPGLKFRIHAPFLLTDNRANIKKGINENELLVTECAVLLREAVKAVKERNKLTVNFLCILPIVRSDFPPHPIFAPLFDAAFSCIYNDRTLPCSDDTFCTWREARFSKDPRLMELVSNRFLTEILAAGQKFHWLHKDFGRAENQQLLDYLECGIARELSRRLDDGYYSAPSVSIEMEWAEVVAHFSQSFLEARSDRWVEELYCYLDKQEAAEWNPPHGDLWRCPIIRLSSGKHVAALREDKKPNAFLQSDATGYYPTVKPTLLREEAALSFIKRLGVGPPDLTARILEVIFPKYTSSTLHSIPIEDHLADFEIVCSFIEKGSGANFELVWNALQQTPFFYARNVATGKCRYCLHREVYLQTPELTTFLAANDAAWFLHDVYLKWVDILRGRFKISEGLRVTFRTAAPTGHVTLMRSHGNHERGLNRFDPDAEVDGLAHALKSPTLEKARIIWNRVLVLNPFLIKGEVERSSKQDYGGSRRFTKASSFGKKLVEMPWLPKPGGGWDLPKNLSMDDLPEPFIRNHEVAAQLGMKQSLITALAAQKKIPVRLLQKILEAAERDPEKVEKLFGPLAPTPAAEPQTRSGVVSATPLPRNPFEKLAEAFVARGATDLDVVAVPPGIIRNPDRYKRELENQLKERKASERPREQRQGVKLRRVWEDAKPEVREFLAQAYNGQCQITGKTFPKRDGKPYFEVWYLISTQQAEWLDEPGNALCVCPEYWAKLEYGARDADPIAVIDMSDAIVRREREHIDVLLVNERHRLVLAIENKIGAKESPGQLTAYCDFLHRHYRGDHIIHVFLDFQRRTPSHPDYFPLSYEELIPFLEAEIKAEPVENPPTLPEILADQYSALLMNQLWITRKTKSVPPPAVMALCKQLGITHTKETSALLGAVRRWQKQFGKNLEEVLYESADKAFGRCFRSTWDVWFRFVPPEFDEIPPLNKGGADSEIPGRMLAYEFFVVPFGDNISIRRPGIQLDLKLIAVKPDFENLKLHLRNAAQSNKMFNRVKSGKIGEFVPLLNHELLSFQEAVTCRLSEVKLRLTNRIDRFAKGIHPEIVAFLKEAVATPKSS